MKKDNILDLLLISTNREISVILKKLYQVDDFTDFIVSKDLECDFIDFIHEREMLKIERY